MDKDKNTKEANHIKIGAQTRVRNVITYALLLLNEKGFNEITITAIGGAIGSLINAVEVIKTDVKLFQCNKMSTVSYQTMDHKDQLLQERLYPKMEVVLSKSEPKEKTEGYQAPLSDDVRKSLKAFSDKRKEIREKEFQERGGSRGRGFGDSRGGRGFGRGFGNRGGRGFSRGGRGGYVDRERSYDDRRGGRGFGDRGGRGFGDRGGRGFGDRGSRGGRGFSDRGGRGFSDRGGNSKNRK